MWPAALILILGFVGCAGERAQIRPEKFSIEVHTYSTSWRPAQWLEIKGDGSVKYTYFPPGIDQVPVEKRFTLKPSKVAKIKKTINRIKFFELNPEYIDNRWPGGWNCEVKVRMDDRVHKVHVMELKVKPIIKLLKAINSVTPLPRHMKFLYYVVF